MLEFHYYVTTLFMAFSIFKTCWFLMNGHNVFCSGEQLRDTVDLCYLVWIVVSSRIRVRWKNNSLFFAFQFPELLCRCFSKNPMIIRADLLLSILLKKKSGWLIAFQPLLPVCQFGWKCNHLSKKTEMGLRRIPFKKSK